MLGRAALVPFHRLTQTIDRSVQPTRESVHGRRREFLPCIVTGAIMKTLECLYVAEPRGIDPDMLFEEFAAQRLHCLRVSDRCVEFGIRPE
jgi:hypothetical protein